MNAPFRIDPMRDTETGQMHHGMWHPNGNESPNLRLRYLNLHVRGDRLGTISGYVPPELFDQLMCTLVSPSYGTPNWCEKCHLDGNDSSCRCAIASNE